MAEFIKVDLRENRQEAWIPQNFPIGNLKKKKNTENLCIGISDPQYKILMPFPPVVFKYLYKFIQLTYQSFKNKSIHFITEGEITENHTDTN